MVCKRSYTDEEADVDDTSEQLSTKIAPVRGCVHAVRTRCGKAVCRCREGDLHGPYFHLVWREHGRRRTRYIPRAGVPAVVEACERYRETHLSWRGFQRMLREFAAINHDVLTGLAAFGGEDGV